MNYWILLSLLLLSLDSFGQVTGPSLFKETKSLNPAVVSQRRARVLSINGKKEQIEKKQDLNRISGGSTATSEVDLNRITAFYGGKGSSGLTSEIFLDTSSGSRTNTLSSDQSRDENETKLQYGNFLGSFSFNRFFGLTLGMVESEYKENYSGTYDNLSYESNFAFESSTKIVRIGSVFNFGLNVGYYFEYGSSTFTSDSSGPVEVDNEFTYQTVGIGVGGTGANYHYEFSFEKSGDEANKLTDFKTFRLSVTLEKSFSWFSVGYIGRYYINGYLDSENILYNNLVYAGLTDNRLENKFNFSFGRSRGHSFSGSISFSSTEGDQGSIIRGFSNNDSDAKYPTAIKERGISLKYSYSF